MNIKLLDRLYQIKLYYLETHLTEEQLLELTIKEYPNQERNIRNIYPLIQEEYSFPNTL